jgi:hypothetical protein
MDKKNNIENIKKQNIWEVVTVNDLVKILKANEKKFVIVGLCLDNTPLPIIKTIKKFLKHYSRIYPNITFLYYCANQKDLGRMSLLTKNVDEYPYIYHIYDISNIFVSVNRANQDTIHEAMNAVEEYYKKDLQNNLLQDNKNTIHINKINNNNNDNDDNNNNDNNDDNNSNDNNDVNNNDNNDINNNDDNNNDNNDAEMNRKVIEHEKLLEKINLFEQMKKKHNIKFLSDLQKRKKDENKR